MGRNWWSMLSIANYFNFIFSDTIQRLLHKNMKINFNLINYSEKNLDYYRLHSKRYTVANLTFCWINFEKIKQALIQAIVKICWTKSEIYQLPTNQSAQSMQYLTTSLKFKRLELNQNGHAKLSTRVEAKRKTVFGL